MHQATPSPHAGRLLRTATARSNRPRPGFLSEIFVVSSAARLKLQPLDRGMLADARRRIAIGRQPGRCCAEGCKPDD